MDREMIAALIVACASVIASVALHYGAQVTVRHAFVLIFPLACIAFPEAMEVGFRSTFHGRVHGDEGPAPGFIIRIVAWSVLVVLVLAHHYTMIARAA